MAGDVFIPGRRLRVRVEKLVWGGDGLARVNGAVCFIPGVAPGDVAEVRITSVNKSFLRADLLRVLEPAPGRREPPCPYFGTCGGCSLQQLTYDAQTAAKQEMVEDALRLLLKSQDLFPAPLIPSPREFGYRIRTRLHVKRLHRGSVLGFYEARSRRIVDVASCLLLPPALDGALSTLRECIPASGEVLLALDQETGSLCVAVNHNATEPGDPEALLNALRSAGLPVMGVALRSPRAMHSAGGTILRYTIDGLRFTAPIDGFMQVNQAMLAALQRTVLEYLSPHPDECILDLYAGSGFFSLPAARSGAGITAVEYSLVSVEQGRLAAESAGLDKVRFVSQRAEDYLPESEFCDAVILDPPRQGAAPEVLSGLLDMAPGRIVFVSCEPVLMARDLTILVKGGYRLRAIQPLDMFPQTIHVECVALLEKTH
ncbi:class I SAM-dependent RNA methyltransferase [bacterium]|nr:class I SAM-dependent RNA methyltransferase [candidate division CSSED10-310 bacterium]